MDRVIEGPSMRDWVGRQAGGLTWRVDPRWAESVLSPEGLRLAEWVEAGLAREVKRSPYRVVYRVEHELGLVFIKHFLVPEVRTKLRQWFRQGKGRNECVRAFALARRGIPTVRPLALGERRRAGFLFENFLITEGLDHAVTLQEFFEEDLPGRPEPERSRLRHVVTRDFARLTAQLHEAGFIHIDFHPGNVLLRHGPDGPLLNLIDLDAVRFKPGLGWTAAMDNLALLDHYFWFRSGRAERYRFFHAYLAARGPSHPDARLLLERIDKRTRAWADRLWRRWARRATRSSKYFRVRMTSDLWAIGPRVEQGEDPLGTALADPDALFDDPRARVLKDSRTTKVVETTLAGLPGPLILKRFHVRRWFEPWLTLARPSRGWASWRAGHHLASRAVPTPANLVYLARRGPRWLPPWLRFLPEECYLVTAKVEPSRTLQDFVLEDLATAAPDARRGPIDALLFPLAHLIATLHGRGLSHRDLKSANVLVGPGEDGADTVRLYLIDLVGVRLHDRVPWGRRVKDLGRLEISLRDAAGKTRGDDLRFLRLYEPRLFQNEFTWKLLWRAVEARGRAKRAQNERRGRPLS